MKAKTAADKIEEIATIGPKAPDELAAGGGGDDPVVGVVVVGGVGAPGVAGVVPLVGGDVAVAAMTSMSSLWPWVQWLLTVQMK